MRGASTAIALLRLYRSSSSSSLVAARSASTISSGTACITIETTTRLGVQSLKNDNNTLLKTLTLARNPASPSLLGFEKLGLSARLSDAVKGLGVLFPSEIHCAAIPEILRGKSVLLTSHFDSVGSFSLGVFSYLLPLLQRLKRNAKSSTEKPNGPRAIVLFSSKELAEEFLRLAEIILEKLKPAVENGDPDCKSMTDSWDVSTGLFVGTPDEVLQKIEEGTVVPDEIKYLVFDEVDDMFNHGLGSDIQKLLSLLKEGTSSTSSQQGFQTILVTSLITKILRKDHSSLVEHLERGQAEVSGMLIELDQTEALHLLESPEALKQKALEVIHSLQPES